MHMYGFYRGKYVWYNTKITYVFKNIAKKLAEKAHLKNRFSITSGTTRHFPLVHLINI